MRQFDLCVIGSGPSGQRAAIQASKLGRRVAVVERMDFVGGVAINTGTIPSKALREAVLDLLGQNRHAAAASLPCLVATDRTNTIQALTASCHRVIQAEVGVVRQHFVNNGIAVVRGTASFVDANTVEIDGPGGKEVLRADHFLIGVGTSPARPANIPFDHDKIITSDELLKLPSLPKSMIIVGGGVIGTEYASMLAALGVRVTLIEGRSRILDFVDAEIGEALQFHLRQAGMTLRLGENVVSIERVDAVRESSSKDGVLVQATLESGKTLRAETLLYCVGRQGATESLNLPAAGLQADNRGRIRVNERYQTSVPHIYAAGDVIGFPALASTSMEQGRLAACHMYGKPAETYRDLLPYGIYSIPEISMVGWTEDRLTAEAVPYEVGIASYKEIARGKLIGDEIGMLKLLVHQESRHILGVHTIGTGATELIHIGQAVMAFNGSIDYFVSTVFNYPTLAECYKVAAYNALNKLNVV